MVTAANAADVTQVDKLLHGEENVVCADAGYTGADRREELKVSSLHAYAHKTPLYGVHSRLNAYPESSDPYRLLLAARGHRIGDL